MLDANALAETNSHTDMDAITHTHHLTDAFAYSNAARLPVAFAFIVSVTVTDQHGNALRNGNTNSVAKRNPNSNAIAYTNPDALRDCDTDSDFDAAE